MALVAVMVYEKTCLQTDRHTHTHTHTHTDTQTHTQTDYNNPPAHARGLIRKEGRKGGRESKDVSSSYVIMIIYGYAGDVSTRVYMFWPKQYRWKGGGPVMPLYMVTVRSTIGLEVIH